MAMAGVARRLAAAATSSGRRAAFLPHHRGRRGYADLVPDAPTRAIGSSLPRAETRVVTATAVDEDGRRKQVRAMAGQSLFKALVNAGLRENLSHQLDDIGSCGGHVCRVTLSPDWMAKLPPATDDEIFILEQHFIPPDFDPSMRCSCQITLTNELNGLVVALVPEKEWDYT